jgi:hypothetical protein
MKFECDGIVTFEDMKKYISDLTAHDVEVPNFVSLN